MNAPVDAQPPPTPPATEHPLRAVQRMGTRASRNGLYIGVIAAILFHLTALESPRYSHIQMRLAVQEMRAGLHEYFWATYDVDVIRDEVKPVEEQAEPEPEPEVVEAEPEVIEPIEPQEIPEDAEVAEEDIYEEIPPAAAEAADVLTSDEPVDLTQHTFVDKDGSRSSGGGYTSKKGTSKSPVRDRRARANGEGKGKGNGTKRVRPKRKDLSRPATLRSSFSNCPFPPQADLEQVDSAVATVAVTIDARGKASSVVIVSDPGYGFGSQARACALSGSYGPALDRNGKAITSTRSIRVTFNR